MSEISGLHLKYIIHEMFSTLPSKGGGGLLKLVGVFFLAGYLVNQCWEKSLDEKLSDYCKDEGMSGIKISADDVTYYDYGCDTVLDCYTASGFDSFCFGLNAIESREEKYMRTVRQNEYSSLLYELLR